MAVNKGDIMYRYLRNMMKAPVMEEVVNVYVMELVKEVPTCSYVKYLILDIVKRDTSMDLCESPPSMDYLYSCQTLDIVVMKKEKKRFIKVNLGAFVPLSYNDHCDSIDKLDEYKQVFSICVFDSYDYEAGNYQRWRARNIIPVTYGTYDEVKTTLGL
jgi:hypothetical protein